MEQEIEELFRTWFETSIAYIADELHNLNGLLSAGDIVKYSSDTKFLGEEFGSVWMSEKTHIYLQQQEKNVRHMYQRSGEKANWTGTKIICKSRCKPKLSDFKLEQEILKSLISTL